MSPLDKDVFTEAAARLAAWRRPLLISHTRPDGDALGSLIAMQSVLRSQGCDARAVLFEPWPDRYAFLARPGSMPILGRDLTEADLTDRDAVIILDTCSYAQLEPLAGWLRAAMIPKLAVDHHRTRDELADVYLLDESAAANCLILFEWAQTVGWRIDHETAEALFVGIAMDTGWFRYSNTDRRVLTAAADLVSQGVRPYELFGPLFQRESPARVRVLGAALGSLQLTADDRLAVMTLVREDFDKAGATRADTEDIVNEPLRIGSVVVSVLLVEQEEGPIRVSLRSKAPRAPGDLDIDVAAFAQAFGGGGHRRASGARVRGTCCDVLARITERLSQHFPPIPGPHDNG